MGKSRGWDVGSIFLFLSLLLSGGLRVPLSIEHGTRFWYLWCIPEAVFVILALE